MAENNFTVVIGAAIIQKVIPLLFILGMAFIYKVVRDKMQNINDKANEPSGFEHDGGWYNNNFFELVNGKVIKKE